MYIYSRCDPPYMRQNICAHILALFEMYKFYLDPPYMQHMLQLQQLPLSIAFSSGLHSDFWMRFEIPN